MIDYNYIKNISAEKGILDSVAEKDYILDWVLWGISNHADLKNKIVFKGGTALHKIYFSDWRFSEDLDFTTIPILDDLYIHDSLITICDSITKLSGNKLFYKK